ncbi:MAG: cytochrome c biogenesis CcdA family protein [Bacillota bacterium]
MRLSESLSVALAFTAGLLSFSSPCVLPLIPAYISSVAGSTFAGQGNGRLSRGKMLVNSLFFVVGFSLIFVSLGLTATAFGRSLLVYRSILQKVGGVFIVVMGLHTSGIVTIEALHRERRLGLPRRPTTAAGSFLLGVVFSLGWSPCVGPILSSILVLAAGAEVVNGGVLLGAYSAGLAIPFLIMAVFMESALLRIRGLSQYLPAISKVSGYALIVLGLLVATDALPLLGGRL